MIRTSISIGSLCTNISEYHSGVKFSNIVHLPVMNGWFNACDTVNLLSGSNTKILSKRSLKLDNIFGSSPGEPLMIVPMSFGFMLKIIRFMVYRIKLPIIIQRLEKKLLILTLTTEYSKTHLESITFFVTGSSSVARKFRS